MVSVHQLLYLLFIFLSNFQLMAGAWDLRQKAIDNAGQIERVSGEDDNGEKVMLILEKFRFLLGSKPPNTQTNPTSGHSVEALPPVLLPVEAVTSSTLPLRSIHVHAHAPSPRSLPPNSVVGGRNEKTKGRFGRFAVVAIVSAGAIVVVLLVILVFQRRRHQIKKRSKFAIHENPINKVSFDPGPELFYLHSLGLFPDGISCVKQTCESMNVAWNGNSMNSPLHDESTCSQDGESLHLVWDSHSSNARLSNVSEGNLSDSSTTSSSPDPNFKTITPDFPSPSSSPHSLNGTPSIAPCSSSSNWCRESLNYRHLSASPLTPTTHPSNPLAIPEVSTLSLNSSDPHCLKQNQQMVLPTCPPRSSVTQSVGSESIPPPPCPPLPPLLPTPFLKGCKPSILPPLPRQGPQFTASGKDGSPLPRLKPLHWDKVRAAPNRSMVWDQLRSNSFEFDEEMIESLFGYNVQSSVRNEEFKSKSPSPSKHVLDPKRLQNITILSKALNATSEQVCAALMQGDGLCLQQLEALVKMVPTKEERKELSNYEGDINELHPAEQLVNMMLNIPFACQRIQAMFYKDTFEDEVVHLRKSFAMLEEACKELRSSRLFLKLLEAVLTMGNRMNIGTIRGGARAFKLDALLKLADVRGTDGKTTLLHFVVQEIIRSEGEIVDQREEDYRTKGLDLVNGLTVELWNVKKTATVDLDVLASSVSNLTDGMLNLRHLVEEDLRIDDQNDSFVYSMKSFLNHAEKSIEELRVDEGRVLLHVRDITEYFHGNASREEGNPLGVFIIVRDFLGMLDRVCKEIRSTKFPNPATP